MSLGTSAAGNVDERQQDGGSDEAEAHDPKGTTAPTVAISTAPTPGPTTNATPQTAS